MDVKTTVATPAPAGEVKAVDVTKDKLVGDTEPDDEETEDTDTDTDVEDKEETKEEPKKEEQRRIKVKYLKEEKELTEEEAVPLIQKGMNYDYIKEKADRAERAEAELAELKMKMTEQEMQKGKDNLEKRLLKDGYDKEEIKQITAEAFKEQNTLLENVKAETQKALYQVKRTAEKEALRKEPYFAEFEAEIDRLATMPMYHNVAIDTIYELQLAKAMRSGKLDEIKQTVKKSAIADYTDSTKRSNVIKSDSTPTDAIDVNSILDKEELEQCKRWGTDPKKIAKYKADNLKKRG